MLSNIVLMPHPLKKINTQPENKLTLLPRGQANSIKKINNSLLNYTRSASSKLDIDAGNRLREIV